MFNFDVNKLASMDGLGGVFLYAYLVLGSVDCFLFVFLKKGEERGTNKM